MRHLNVAPSQIEDAGPRGQGDGRPERSFEEVRRRLLTSVFVNAGRVFVVADDGCTRDFLDSEGSPFVSAVEAPALENTTSTDEVLALSLDEPCFIRAAELARRIGRSSLYVLLSNTPCDNPSPTSSSWIARASRRLRELGFAIVGLQRVFWVASFDPSEPTGAAPCSRTARLDRETREVLVQCQRRDDPEIVTVLEERVVTLGRQLDLLSELQVQQARVREAEARRLGRLEELEATMERLEKIRSVQARALLVEESKEIRHLREEVAFMKTTRFWRLGERYWALRRWLSERNSP
jgi:hypothetical protein